MANDAFTSPLHTHTYKADIMTGHGRLCANYRLETLVEKSDPILSRKALQSRLAGRTTTSWTTSLVCIPLSALILLASLTGSLRNSRTYNSNSQCRPYQTPDRSDSGQSRYPAQRQPWSRLNDEQRRSKLQTQHPHPTLLMRQPSSDHVSPPPQKPNEEASASLLAFPASPPHPSPPMPTWSIRAAKAPRAALALCREAPRLSPTPRRTVTRTSSLWPI